jgi:hypothetical protein
MRFYYENSMGDKGYFSEKDLIKAIYTAWNIEADLYLLHNGVKKIENGKPFSIQAKLIFAPYESNDYNTDMLKSFGYEMEDGEVYREIIEIKTGNVVKYDWSEVIKLIQEKESI